jgi:hypothetical protein
MAAIVTPFIGGTEPGAGVGRAMARTSTGTLIAAVPVSAADWSFRLAWSSNNGASWNTIANGPWLSNDHRQWSITVDASDNIHLVWGASVFDTNVNYRMWAKGTGNSWTHDGSRNALLHSVSNQMCTQCDIEVLSTGAVVAMWSSWNTTGTKTGVARVAVRTTGGTWTGHTTLETASNSVYMVSVARDAANNGGILMAYARNTDRRVFLRRATITSSTGAIALSTLMNLPKPTHTAGGERGLVFPVSSGVWTYVGARNGPSSFEGSCIAARIEGNTIAWQKESPIYGMSLPPARAQGFAITPDGNPLVIAGGDGARAVRIMTCTQDLPWYNHVGISSFNEPNVVWASSGIARNIPTNPAFVIRRAHGPYVSYAMTGGMTTTLIRPAAPGTAPDGSTVWDVVQNSRPEFTITRGGLPAVPFSGRIRVDYDVADNSQLNANLHTASVHTVSFTSSYRVPSVSARPQGIQYVRARVVDAITGQAATYTPTRGFLISHPPQAKDAVPANNILVRATSDVTISWMFYDPDPEDSQTAYQVTVENNDTGALVADTGKVMSSAKFATVAIPANLKDVVLRQRVTVWDTDDVAGTPSPYGLFRVGDPPTFNSFTPDGSVLIENPAPPFTWDVTFYGGRTQGRYLLEIREAGVVVHSSGWVHTTMPSHTPPPILENNKTYTATVTVEDSNGLRTSAVSTFSTQWIAPPTPVYVIDAQDGYVRLQWSNNTEDAEFYSYRVLRRLVGDTTWTLATEIFFPEPVYVYRDWNIPNGTWEYAVVQVAARFGTGVPSGRSVRAVTLACDTYWLIHPTDETYNFKLRVVKSDDFSDETEEEVFALIGRGRHTDYGDKLGFIGTLTAELRDDPLDPTNTARAQRFRLAEIKDRKATVGLRNPFGDLWWVTMGDVGISRVAGVAQNEYVTVTIPYRQVPK